MDWTSLTETEREHVLFVESVLRDKKRERFDKLRAELGDLQREASREKNHEYMMAGLYVIAALIAHFVSYFIDPSDVRAPRVIWAIAGILIAIRLIIASVPALILPVREANTRLHSLQSHVDELEHDLVMLQESTDHITTAVQVTTNRC